MESGNLELIITAVSITGTILAAFGFLHRDLRRLDAKVEDKFERIEKEFDGEFKRIEKKFDGKFDGLRTVLTSVQVSVARIEGHLGIGFPAHGEQRADDEPPERAA